MPRKTKEEYNAYMADYMLRRYHTRREEAIEYLGECCVRCGSIDFLELDHIDPKLKSFSISQLWSISYDRYREELEKCQLLCNPCHKEKHMSTYECGTPQKYWRGCHCPKCTQANTRHNKQYKAERV